MASKKQIDDDEDEVTNSDENDTEAEPEVTDPSENDTSDVKPTVLPTGFADNSPEDVKAQQIRDYIASKYATASNPSTVQDAQDNALSMNKIANVGNALESIAKANSMARGGAGVDSDFYKGIKAEGQQQVAQAMNDRSEKIQAFVQNNDIQNKVLQNVMAQGSYDKKQKAEQFALDANDPDSQISKNAQDGFKAVFAEAPGIKDLDISGFSKADIDAMSKNVDVMEKIKSAEDLKKYMLAFQQDRINQQHEMVNQQNAVKDSIALGKDLDSQTASIRTGIGQAQSKVNGAVKLMAFVDVTPQEIDLAKKDPAARSELVKKLNQLTPQQYSEVVSGLMSQISGGAGSFGQLESLKAPTASQTSANVQTYFSSKPVPANMGEIILNNLLTLKNEKDVSQQIVDSHNNQMRKKHALAFSHPQTKDDAESLLASYANQSPATDIGNAPANAPVKMKDPNGKLYLVPSNQVQTAKTKNWTEINAGTQQVNFNGQ